MRLDGKVALITGGGSGMGQVASELFASEGARVVLTDVNDEAGEATAAAIGNDALYVHADVSREGEARAMVEAAIARFDRLDVLYNNAGVMLPDDGSVHATEESIWDTTLAVNVKGVAFGCKYGIPAMLDERRRVDHQRGVVRRVARRRHVADGLHRLEGRRARDDPGDRRRVRAQGHPLQRALPGSDRDTAPVGPVVGRGRRSSADSSTSRWGGSGMPRSSRRRRCSWRATIPAT